MTIFGESRLGRIGYAIVILLLLGFDFAKAPIERYLVRQHDLVADQLLAPRPVEKVEPARKINGREMPFMLQAHEDIIRDLATSGRKMNKAQLEAEIEKRLKNVSPMSVLAFETNKPVRPEVRQLADIRSQLADAYPVAVFIMTAATIIGLLWMVSSRLRDIGWPQYYLWILIAPVFLPRLIEMPLAPIAAQALNLAFHAGVVFLALIPGEGDRPAPPIVPLTARPTTIQRRPGQFGRLGTN
jgi:hypothetical protein